MLIELTQAIIDELKNNGLDTKEFGFKDLKDWLINPNLTRPAVNIAILSSTAQQVTLYTYKFRAVVSVLVVFPLFRTDAQGEGKRREGCYKLIEGISNFLTLQKFGLELENPLIPMGFRDVTPGQFVEKGFRFYDLQFWCSYNVSMVDKEGDAGDLSKIYLEYWLKPQDAAAEPPQADDLIITVTP